MRGNGNEGEEIVDPRILATGLGYNTGRHKKAEHWLLNQKMPITFTLAHNLSIPHLYKHVV